VFLLLGQCDSLNRDCAVEDVRAPISRASCRFAETRMSGCSRSRRRDANASQSFENGVTFAIISAIATVVHTDIPALVIGVISLLNESPLFHLGTRPNGQCVTAEGTPQSSVSASMASCSSASPHSNVTPPHHACPLVAEREQSVESPALSGRCQDISPCSKALGWPHVR
jgi:hypothetical protein